MSLILASFKSRKLEFVLSFVFTFLYILSIRTYQQFGFKNIYPVASWYLKLFNFSYYATVITAKLEDFFNIYNEGLRFGTFYILIVLHVIVVNLVIYMLVVCVRTAISTILNKV